jgi:hypothetical protein
VVKTTGFPANVPFNQPYVWGKQNKCKGTQLCVSNVRAAVDLQFVVFQVALDVKELSTSP